MVRFDVPTSTTTTFDEGIENNDENFKAALAGGIADSFSAIGGSGVTLCASNVNIVLVDATASRRRELLITKNKNK